MMHYLKLTLFYLATVLNVVLMPSLFANGVFKYQVEIPLVAEGEPCALVIFGATGDLTARKLVPALYQLTDRRQLSRNTAIIGFARGNHTDETFRMLMGDAKDAATKNPLRDLPSWDQFENTIFYNQADFESDDGYEKLQKLLQKVDEELGTKGNRIYYLATQPSFFSTIVKKLHEHKLTYGPKDSSWSRVIIEKPFGVDLESALDLQKYMSEYLSESQVYRMDHYLGKEGVQNILTMRFANAFFEPIWNKENIDNIQITLSEDIGIGSRGRLWEETGTLRDVFQNHVMQLLALIAMEPPKQFEEGSVHAEKIKVLKAIRPFPVTEIDNYLIRAQYGPGMIHGGSVLGYRQEKGVPGNSTADTFIAAKMYIDNVRWSGVPFYLRAGKRLPCQTTQIVVTFKNRYSDDPAHANVLFIRIQPEAGIFLKTLSKVPSLANEIGSVVFGFKSDEHFDNPAPEAYEKLFYDCVNGDNSLFVDAEEQLAAWRLLDPVLEYWKLKSPNVHSYDAGTWGPAAADRLLENGHAWQLLENTNL